MENHLSISKEGKQALARLHGVGRIAAFDLRKIASENEKTITHAIGRDLAAIAAALDQTCDGVSDEVYAKQTR